MNNWYVLFVKTGYEEKIISSLNEKLDSRDTYAFSLKKERIFRRNGVDNIILDVLFPGYIFIKTGKMFEELISEIRMLKEIKGVYRFLSYSDKSDYVLREDEKRRLIELCGNSPNYCLKHSVGIMVGNRVHVLSGALVGKEVKIKKIDRHKRNAVVDMIIFGEMREITVSLEIIERCYKEC